MKEKGWLFCSGLKPDPNVPIECLACRHQFPKGHWHKVYETYFGFSKEEKVIIDWDVLYEKIDGEETIMKYGSYAKLHATNQEEYEKLHSMSEKDTRELIDRGFFVGSVTYQEAVDFLRIKRVVDPI